MRIPGAEYKMKNPIDTCCFRCYNQFQFSNLILQTDEAEITAMMPLQRACDAENQAGNKLSNGPRRVQSNARLRRVFCNVSAYVSCRGYVCTLPSARLSRETRWHRG